MLTSFFLLHIAQLILWNGHRLPWLWVEVGTERWLCEEEKWHHPVLLILAQFVELYDMSQWIQCNKIKKKTRMNYCVLSVLISSHSGAPQCFLNFHSIEYPHQIGVYIWCDGIVFSFKWSKHNVINNHYPLVPWCWLHHTYTSHC